jgi:hypothetical protein
MNIYLLNSYLITVKAINTPIKIRNNAPIILNKINPSDALNYQNFTLKLLCQLQRILQHQ